MGKACLSPRSVRMATCSPLRDGEATCISSTGRAELGRSLGVSSAPGRREAQLLEGSTACFGRRLQARKAHLGEGRALERSWQC